MGGEVKRPAPVVTAQGPDTTGLLEALARPLPEPDGRLAVEDAPAGSPGLAYRLDASSPDAMLASLRRAEPHLTSVELDRLRVALTTGQMLMARKIGVLAMSNPMSPQLSDEDLFRMAFGQMDGMTMAEVISYGERLLPSLTESGASGAGAR